MKLLLYILLLSSFAHPAKLCAQDKNKEATNFDFGLAIMPQYAFANTMRLDLDMTLKNKNVLTISTMFSFARHSSSFFSNDDDYYDYYYDDEHPQNIALTGAGLKLTLRHFFGDFNNNSGLYLGGGLHYRYSHVEYKVADWAELTEDGNNYLSYGLTEKEENFNQFGIDFILGYQMYLTDNIYGDIFGGWGLRISDFSDGKNEDYWSETVFDLAYSGYIPLLGFRLGIFF